MRSEIATQIALDHIRYSQVWEDHELLEIGLEITPDDDVLSITSAGDNSFALLLQEPRSVTSFDMNPAQTALAKLKVAAIRALPDHADFVALLGFAEHPGRAEFYRDVLRAELDEPTRAYWDANEDVLDAGVVHTGRLEGLMASWREEARPKFWSDDLIDRLFSPMSLEEQRELYETEARTPEFVGSLLRYFSKEMLATGRSTEQLQHVSIERTGEVFVQRFDRVCTEMSIAQNPYLWLLLRGEHGPWEHATAYLRPENYAKLRSGLLDRLEILTVELEQILNEREHGAFSKANLSDAFEYMSPELSDHVFGVFAERLRSGGRLAYWNLLVPRSSPESLSERLTQHTSLSADLLARDRAWFYGAFHVEEVR